MKLLAGYLVPHPPIIIPDVGYGEEKKAAATCQAMHEVGREVAKLEPETIVLISPHGPLFSDAISIRSANPLIGNLGNFGASNIKLDQANDLEFIEHLIKMAYDINVPTVIFDKVLARRFDMNEMVDHGAIVPLHFINQYYYNYKLVVITYGLLSEEALYQFGMAIQSIAEELGRRTLVIASGDLSHHLCDSENYTFKEEGSTFDKTVIDYLAKQEYVKLMTLSPKLVAAAGECGKKSLEILLGSLDQIRHETQVKSYEGPFGVGYGIVGFKNLESGSPSLLPELKEVLKTAHEIRKSREDVYIQLARMTIEHFVKTGERLAIPDMAKTPELLGKSRGVFVSIKDRGGLRGCMGITAGLEINLASEIISNAIKACSEDPRFPAIEVEELEDLQISVDVLSPSERVTDVAQLNPEKYGVIVTHDYKRGLLLPNLESVDTISEQIRIALNKAGIKPEEDYTVERFTVERHEV